MNLVYMKIFLLIGVGITCNDEREYTYSRSRSSIYMVFICLELFVLFCFVLFNWYILLMIGCHWDPRAYSTCIFNDFSHIANSQLTQNSFGWPYIMVFDVWYIYIYILLSRNFWQTQWLTWMKTINFISIKFIINLWEKYT